MRLTRIVLLWTVLIGLALALIQIALDAHTQNAELDRSARQAMRALQHAAAEAVYEIDNDLAAQVLDGLSVYPGVYASTIVMKPDMVLAKRDGSPVTSRWRVVTDLLFDPQRSYLESLPNPRGGEPLGEMRMDIDTYVAGRIFLERSLITAGTALLWSALVGLVLLAVIYRFLTAPLMQLASALGRVSVANPESAAVPVSPRHQRDELGHVARTINGLFDAIRESLARRAEAEARASYLQQFDDLTGLANRQLFMTRLTHAIATAPTRGESLALLMLDLRAFRDLNQSHGSALGDAVLREVARRLESFCRGSLFVARLVDDKFAMLVHEGVTRDTVRALANRVLDDLALPMSLGHGHFVLTAWVGAALYPDDASSAEMLLQSAEAGLEMAKREGTDSVGFYDAIRDDETSTRQRLSLDLRRREVIDELELVFEPLVSAGDGQVTALEALLRWRHPEYGLLRPGSFIRLAEENGAIQVIGDWVLRHACAKAVAWRLTVRDNLRIAVNVSGAQLRHGHLDARIASVLEATGLPPQNLELEITETAIVDNIKMAAATLQRVRELGVGIVIDDFGTGHASLGYLKRLPVTKLKIDMSFVRDVLTDASDATIVRAIVGLGHNLGLVVAAEGVETAAQRRFLQDIGCDVLQGGLFGIGMRETEALAYATRWAGSTRELRVVPPR
ncbi:putative bifunctional diguanylate cyclase/phosphodiesterase [Tahibacter amnicola]|uniref:EAL domain-containing protein n=1 Tax=Tahibacter amnicola TaxID=2976241 RepID=A0ABY6BF87_9GAMM|nr:bifunctional diguanylate cyclase/phosphodiesterase [Tahibacter amnicola]UXI66522.1 EAL domain-containing protein [Tahibacter amnicola]